MPQIIDISRRISNEFRLPFTFDLLAIFQCRFMPDLQRVLVLIKPAIVCLIIAKENCIKI